VLVEGGHIREVSDRPIKSATAEAIDLAGRILRPGLIDAHVHVLGNLCKGHRPVIVIQSAAGWIGAHRLGAMKQITLAAAGFERYAKTTRRAVFLGEMERVVPWPGLCGLIEPFYPKAGNGRPPVGVERMLRIYFLQQWFNLSDPAVEEALRFAGDARFRRH